MVQVLSIDTSKRSRQAQRATKQSDYYSRDGDRTAYSKAVLGRSKPERDVVIHTDS